MYIFFEGESSFESIDLFLTVPDACALLHVRLRYRNQGPRRRGELMDRAGRLDGVAVGRDPTLSIRFRIQRALHLDLIECRFACLRSMPLLVKVTLVRMNS